MLKKSRRLQLIVTAVATALLAVGMYGLFFTQVKHDMRALSTLVASRQLRAIENVLDKTIHVLEQLKSQAGVSCDTAGRRLQEAGSLEPYFRAIVLIKNSGIYCSSVTRDTFLSARDLFGENGLARPQFLLVAGTPMQPDRPALLVYLPNAQDGGIMGVIDGVYLTDILNTLNPVDFQQAIASFPGGTLHGGQRSNSVALLRLQSARYPLSVALYPQQNALQKIAALGMSFPILLALLLAVALALAIYWYFGVARQLSGKIKKGLKQGEFEVHYQPIIDLRSGRCVGAEALLRWQHPSHGTISPDFFIPHAESSALIVDLTRSVLRMIRADVRSGGLPHGFYLSVNLAERHLRCTQVVDDVRALYGDLIADYPLVLEVTERQAIQDPDAARQALNGLRALGARISLDDFGAENSSFGYLQMITFDYLKIDRAYLPASDTDLLNRGIFDTVVGLAQRLEIKIVAEGIEHAFQRDYALQLGVQSGQGYLFSKAVNFKHLTQLVDRIF